MNKWHALVHSDLLWLSLFFVNFVICPALPLSARSTTPAQMGASEWSPESRVFLLPFVCDCKERPPRLLPLCKCPLPRWWIFTGWIQQQGLIEFLTIRLITGRHMEPPARTHKNAYAHRHERKHNHIHTSARASKKQMHTNTSRQNHRHSTKHSQTSSSENNCQSHGCVIWPKISYPDSHFISR